MKREIEIFVKFNQQVILLIGVYLTSLSTKLEYKIKYLSQLLILKEKLNSCKMEQKKIKYYWGLKRRYKKIEIYYTDLKLEEFISNSHCKSIMNINETIDFSYYKIDHKSLMDHAIVNVSENGIV